MIRPPYPPGELLQWPLRWLRSSTAGLDTLPRMPRRWTDASEPAGPRARVVLLGDVMTVWGGGRPRVDPAVRDVVGRADLVIANCEGPVTDSGRVRRGTFGVVRHRLSVDFLAGLAAALGSEPRRWVMSIANNHIGDDGLVGVERTHRVLEAAGFGVAGRRGPGRSPVMVRELGGSRLGVACWTRWLNHRELPPDDGVWRSHDVDGLDWASVRACHRVDMLLAFPHWDREFCLAPSGETRAVARRLVASGVGLVVGHHPHVAQPWEMVDGRPVLYSIGSFHGPLPWIWRPEHRLGWMAEVEIGRDAGDTVRPLGLTLHPVVLVREGRGHALVPLEAAPEADRRRITPVVDRLFRPSGRTS